MKQIAGKVSAVISQTVKLFITTAVKTSDPAVILKDPQDMVHNP
jgi:hypothetical protein